MKIITGTVVQGKVCVSGAGLEEGAQVAVLAPDAEEPIELTLDEQSQLLFAMEEVSRGDFVDGSDLLSELRARTTG